MTYSAKQSCPQGLTLELYIGLPIENLSVLKEVELRDLYCHEIKFKGQVGDTDHIYRILSLPRRGNERRRKNVPNAVFVTMFFPTTVSEPLSKKLFYNSVKYMMYLTAHLKSRNNISNGKRHIRITPFKTKHNLLHEIFFDDS